MTRKRLWIIISIVVTLGWLGGGTMLFLIPRETESRERAHRLSGSCLSAGLGEISREGTPLCTEPWHVHERGFQARLTESALFAGLCAGAFWALFALVFFLRRSRNGRGEPETGA